MALAALPMALTGRTQLAVFPMLGAFTTTFGRNLPYARRARVLAVVALAMTACVGFGSGLAALVDPRASAAGAAAVIAAMAVVAGLAKFICDATQLTGLGAVLMLFSFAVAANGPADHPVDVLTQTALAAMGAFIAWALSLAAWPLQPDRPQRLAVAVALRDLAQLLEQGGDAKGTAQLRNRATAGLLQAYRSLGLTPLATTCRDGRRREWCVPLADLAWSLLIRSVRPQPPDVPTARHLRRHARLITVRYRRLPPLPEEAFPPPGPGEEAEAAPLKYGGQATGAGGGEAYGGRPSTGGLVVPALRMTLGTGLAGGVAAFLSFGHGYWAALSAAAVLHSVNVRATVLRSIQRALGTAAGLLITIGVLAVHPAPVAVICLIVLFEFLMEYFVPRNYGLGVVFLTPLALLLSDVAAPEPTKTLVYDRMVGSILGIVIGVACGLLVVHVHAAVRVQRAMSGLAEATWCAEHALADSPGPDPAVEARLAAAVVELREADDAAAGELHSVGIEPAELAAAEQRAYRLLDQLVRRRCQ
ncbi:FUSC family protein [Streptomyces sp. V3I7]|uniref:FUSC family protein n=1 Tax=Streptomyces sp. V3I7 TaxID=3042278 RepID=UPI0027D77C12|nr:FUSC family protein [Streptomyces sp. V3I7]